MPADPLLSVPQESASWLRRMARTVLRLGAPVYVGLLTITVTSGALGLMALVLTWRGAGEPGTAFWLALLVAMPLALAFAVLSFGLFHAMERSQSKLDRLATTDSLTGLSNRRSFMRNAQREIGLAQRHHLPLALLILDIDRFQSINDAHGQAVGDQVLIEVCRRCRHVLRTTDLLARWGGEEFVVLLPSTPSDHAHQLAERLRQAVAMSHQLLVEQRPIWATVSIGAAGIAPGETATLDALLQTAGEALVHAKNSGRDQVFSAAWAARRSNARA